MADIFPSDAFNEPIDNAGGIDWTTKREYAFDFDKNKFITKNGKPVTVSGLPALKIWIEKALRTARYRFPIYSHAYGNEIEDLIGIGLPISVLESEIKRAIKEALIYDDRIVDVTDFSISFSGDKLQVTFRVDSIFGDTDMEVSFDV